MATHPKMLEPTNLSESGSPTIAAVLTLAETKSHLRVDDNDSDALIMTLIDAATNKLDGWNGDLGRALITQSWRADYDCFPSVRRIDLPLSPIQAATVRYYDSDNVLQTYAAANYAVHEDAIGAFVFRDEGQSTWPGTYDRKDAVQITMTVGYGDTGADVPRPIRHAMLMMIGHWFESRESVSEMSMESVPMGVDSLLFNYKRHRF